MEGLAGRLVYSVLALMVYRDGGYATSTSQIPLNATSKYDGGSLCFFVNDHLHLYVPQIPGSLVQHKPAIPHGVTSVTRGTRNKVYSLWI